MKTLTRNEKQQILDNALNNNSTLRLFKDSFQKVASKNENNDTQIFINIYKNIIKLEIDLKKMLDENGVDFNDISIRIMKSAITKYNLELHEIHGSLMDRNMI